MSVRDILAIVTSHRTDEHVLAFSERLQEQTAGHLTTLVVKWMASLPFATEGGLYEPMWSELISAARKDLEQEVAGVKARLERDADVETPDSLLLELAAARQKIGVRACHADVSIVARPTKANDEEAHALVEAALFASGRPVIVVPPEWKPAEIGRSVLVCWKPTREAARALGDAEDFLARAGKVTVATVDARPSEGSYGPHPGADISSHLARRGVAVDLVNLDSMGRGEARTIQDQALAIGADLIVMGGYGHSRLGEIMFGGMTRDMLRTSKLPLLMAH